MDESGWIFVGEEMGSRYVDRRNGNMEDAEVVWQNVEWVRGLMRGRMRG